LTLAQADRENRISTDPAHSDPDLRGRTYAIPFDTVWNASVRLAAGGIPRWLLVRQDDIPGMLQAEVRPRLWGENADVLIRIRLDQDAQTRVDVVASSRDPRWDWGGSRRRVIRFLNELDRSLAASGSQILAPAELTPSSS
jgi:hypothetical protein